jgi:hypothetical protein
LERVGGESFLRKIIHALAICICGPAFAQEISVPFEQGGSRAVDGKAITREIMLDARMYTSLPIDGAGTLKIEGLTETFDGVHCAGTDQQRHAWGWTYDNLKALFEADGAYAAGRQPMQISDGFLSSGASLRRGILTAVLIDAGKYGQSGYPPIPGMNNVDMTRSRWLEFRRIANSTPGITIAAVGKQGTLAFNGAKGYLVLFMNDRIDVGGTANGRAYAGHQGSICVRVSINP